MRRQTRNSLVRYINWTSRWLAISGFRRQVRGWRMWRGRSGSLGGLFGRVGVGFLGVAGGLIRSTEGL